MTISKYIDYKGGWFAGNFEPSAYKTDLFEVCFKKHWKGEKWDTHYHKLGTEINLLIKGKMILQDIVLESGDVFVIHPYEIADPVFLENCELFIIKTPSNTQDKYVVESLDSSFQKNQQ